MSAFPFLRLPPEIRNRVYFLAFSALTLTIDPHPGRRPKLYVCWVRQVDYKQHSLWRRTALANDAALVRSSRQVHRETHLLLFKYAKYSIVAKYQKLDSARWMRLLDQSMQATVWSALDEEQKALALGTGLYGNAVSDAVGQD